MRRSPNPKDLLHGTPVEQNSNMMQSRRHLLSVLTGGTNRRSKRLDCFNPDRGSPAISASLGYHQMHPGRLWQQTPWPFRTSSDGGGGKGGRMTFLKFTTLVGMSSRCSVLFYCAWWYCSFDTASRSNSPWRSGSTRSLGGRGATATGHQSASPSPPTRTNQRRAGAGPRVLSCQGWFRGDCRRPPPSHWCRWSVSARERTRKENGGEGKREGTAPMKSVQAGHD